MIIEHVHLRPINAHARRSCKIRVDIYTMTKIVPRYEVRKL